MPSATPLHRITRAPTAARTISRSARTVPAPCFVPTDCPAGMRCCLVFTFSSGVVICQASALCVGDGVSTLIACATGADCPAVAPTCMPFGSTPSGRELSVCRPPF